LYLYLASSLNKVFQKWPTLFDYLKEAFSFVTPLGYKCMFEAFLGEINSLLMLVLIDEPW